MEGVAKRGKTRLLCVATPRRASQHRVADADALDPLANFTYNAGELGTRAEGQLRLELLLMMKRSGYRIQMVRES
jgi:hypothetical protein